MQNIIINFNLEFKNKKYKNYFLEAQIVLKIMIKYLKNEKPIYFLKNDQLFSGKNWELDLVIQDSKKQKKLNYIYRQKNKDTDVLSFSSWEEVRNNPILLNQFCKQKNIHIGSLFLSSKKIKKQAIEYKHSEMDEFLQLLIHGVLHLFGFDHVYSQKEAAIMAFHEKIIWNRYQLEKNNKRIKELKV